MTNRSRPGRVGDDLFSPDGSRVRLKSRFRLYSVSCARALAFDLTFSFTALEES
jgi:hypothetical protein